MCIMHTCMDRLPFQRASDLKRLGIVRRVTLNHLEYPFHTTIDILEASDLSTRTFFPELEVTDITKIPTFDFRSRGNPHHLLSHTHIHFPCFDILVYQKGTVPSFLQPPFWIHCQETANSCPWEREWQPVRT